MWRLMVLGAVLVGLAGATPAVASPPQGPDPFTSVPDEHVGAIVTGQNATYVAGTFDGVGTASGSAVAFDSLTGARHLLPAIAGGAVQAAVADGSGGWYLGGDFDRVGGVVRYGLAHIRADGSVDAAFPQLRRHPLSIDGNNEEVQSLALSADGKTLYLGGSFSAVGGQARDSLAAVNLQSSSLSPWDPQLSAGATVSTLLVGEGPSAGWLFIGGSFSKVGLVAVDNLAKVGEVNGLADSAFKPEPTNAGNPQLASVRTLALNSTGASLYVAGDFGQIGGQSRLGLARLATTGGLEGAADSWDPSPNRGVDAILVGPFGSTVYVGGGFTAVGAVSRNGLAAIDAGTGIATGWQPALPAHSHINSLTSLAGQILLVGAFDSVDGVPRPGAASVDPGTAAVGAFNPSIAGHLTISAVDGNMILLGGRYLVAPSVTRTGLAALDAEGRLTDFAPQVDGIIRALALSSDGRTLYIGGQFTTVDGQPRASLAALDTATGAVKPWSSAITQVKNDGLVAALALSRDGQSLYVGGVFDHLGSDLQPRSSLGAVSTRSGKATAWVGGVSGPGGGRVSTLSLSPDAATLYAGGEFTTAGHNGQPRQNIAALSTGGVGDATPWAPDATGPGGGGVSDLAVAPRGTVYIAGQFTTAGHNAQPRDDLAALSAVGAGDATAWNPSIATSDPNNPAASSALAISEDGTTVFVGGQFDTIGGQPRIDLGEVSSTTGAATAWNPDPGQYYDGIEVINAAAGAVRIGGSFQRIGTTDVHNYAQFTSPPAALTPPHVTGSPVYGRTLTCNAGTFSNSPFRFAFGWTRDGHPIVGQTAAIYRVRGSDSGHALACMLSAANARGSASATSQSVLVGPYLLGFSARRVRHGAYRFSFRLTERARVTIAVRRMRGRRLIGFRTLRVNAHGGLNRVTLKPRGLKRGARYLVTISARDPHGLRSNQRRLRFKVRTVRRHG